MFGLESILKSLTPLVEKNLTDEKISGVYDHFLAGIEKQDDEARHIVTITKEKDEKVYLCVVAMSADMKIMRVKKQMLLKTAVSEIISKVK